MPTTPGRLMLEERLPKGVLGPADLLDKKGVARLAKRLADLNDGDYGKHMRGLQDVASESVTMHGRSASLNLDDFTLPPVAAAKVLKMREEIRGIVNDPGMTPDEKAVAVSARTAEFSKTIDKELTDEMFQRGSGIAEEAVIGSRGAPGNIRQILVGGLLFNDSRGRPVPWPGLNGYAQGISAMDFWASAHGSRKGLADVQLATAKAGYYGKQIGNIVHRSVVTVDDCGATDTGLGVDGDSADNIGSLLAEEVNGIPAGTMITDDNLPALAGKEIRIRSPLTCRAKHGVCAKCAGLRETGGLPAIGDKVGLNAVRSYVEPLTQSAVSSKHVAGDARVDPNSKGAFEMAKQMTSVPSAFASAAVLVKEDGVISAVTKASQGGHQITVGKETYYAPEYRSVSVKPGDHVEAGDAMTDGIPNPAELVPLKGIGEGRKYFMERMGDILGSGAKTARRNLELLARSFISKVRVTDPDGFDGHIIGDLVDYDAIAADWEPRAGHKAGRPNLLKGMYLEKPVLHYSIGTRITPRLAKTMESKGVREILAHPAAPPFEPEVVRSEAFMAEDEDWMSALAGERLRQSMVDHAMRGARSERTGPSYYSWMAQMSSPGGAVDVDVEDNQQ